MKNFLKDNFKWIVFVVITLLVSNLLTSININSLSKKDKQKIQHKLDSLDNRFKQLEFIHVQELAKRRKIFLEDSLLIISLKSKQQEDKLLIIKQSQAMAKFKSYSSKKNLQLLDSAYNAENIH